MKTIFNTLAIFSLLLTVNLVPQSAVAQQNDYKNELDIIFKAFQEQDYDIIKPLLDEKVKVADVIPIGMNDAIFPQIMIQLPVPESYKVIKVETVGANRKITTEYTYKDSDRKREQYFTFNKEGKVIVLDILSDAKVGAQYKGK